MNNPKKPAAPTPRNPVARAAQTVAKGSGRHTNKMRDSKMGKTKHKGQLMNSISALESRLMSETMMIMEEFEKTMMELKSPEGTAFLKFSAKDKETLYAYVGLGTDYREIRAVNAVIPETIIANGDDLSRLVQKVFKDPFYSFEKIKIVFPKSVEKHFPFVADGIAQSQRRFENQVEVVSPEPIPKDGGGGIRRKKPKIKHEYRPYEPEPKQFDPRKMRVQFSIVDPQAERLLRSSGYNFQNGMFTIPYEQYKDLIEKLKKPEVIDRFGRRDLIKDKKFIEAAIPESDKKKDELVDENWRKKLAAAGMAGMMGIGGAAGAADKAPDPATDKYNFTDTSLEFPDPARKKLMPRTPVKDLNPVDRYELDRKMGRFSGSYGEWLKVNQNNSGR